MTDKKLAEEIEWVYAEAFVTNEGEQIVGLHSRPLIVEAHRNALAAVIAALRREPSGEMVMVRGMRLADEMVDAMNQCRLSLEGSARQAEWREAHDKARCELVAMLSAAEASKEAR